MFGMGQDSGGAPLAPSRRRGPQKSAPAEDKAVRPRRPKRRRATSTEHSELGEKLIAGVPARIMRPRLVFISCLAAIIAFGLLMVYSASAVEALKEYHSSTYFLFRQARFIAIGLVLFAIISTRRLSWSAFNSTSLWIVWGLVIALLLLTLVIGSGGDEWGAKRWVFGIQPSEFAKPVIILIAAKIFGEYYEDCSIDTGTAIKLLLIGVAIPMILILRQPDFGTTAIIGITVLTMAYFSGISYRLLFMIVALLVIIAVPLIFGSDYRAARMLTDPWSDPYGDGYQATLAIMAFASGGLFGRGIGNSTMKYNYLPEAHNDYILAIVGEELGFVGTVLFVVVFLALIAAGIMIAMRSPTLRGQLIAAGCSVILVLQFFINALGILGVTPMTGKPLPFISYGGSSMIASMILAALIFRVSLESNVRTAHDARRDDLSVMSEQDIVSDHIGRSTAGAVRVRRGSGTAVSDATETRRAGRPRSDGSRAAFSVYDGGAARTVRPSDRPQGGYERINLSGGETDRLRTDGVRSSTSRRSGDGRDRGRRGSGTGSGYRRDRYDR